MAAYEAIRDSFREFNRTLIDSQQWNAQHESRMADQRLKETMLMNQLNQQTFNNRIKEEQLRLSRETNKRGADALAETIRNNDRQFTFNTDKFNKEHEREIKRINALNASNDTKNKLMSEKNKEYKEHLDLLDEEQKLKNAEAVRQADLIAQSNELTPVIIPPKYQSNPVVMDKLKDQVLMRYGGSVQDDGTVLDKQGNELKVPMHEYRAMKFQADAIMAVNDNKHKQRKDERDVLLRAYSKMKSAVGQMTSNYDQPKAAAMKRKMKVTQAKIDEHNQFLNSLNTAKGQHDYLMYQANEIRAAAGNLSAPGKGDDPKTAAQYVAIADAKEAQAIEILKGGTSSSNVAGLVTKPVTKNGKIVGLAVFNKLNKTWSFRGKTYNSPDEFPDGIILKQDKETSTLIKDSEAYRNIQSLALGGKGDTMWSNLDGDERGALAVSNQMYSTMKSELPESEWGNLERIVVEETKKMHNELAAEYQSNKSTLNDSAFQTWLKTTFEPKLKQNKFSYYPKENWNIQIMKSDF